MSGNKENVPVFDGSVVSERLLQAVARSLGTCAMFEQLIKPPFSFSQNKIVEAMLTLSIMLQPLSHVTHLLY